MKETGRREQRHGMQRACERGKTTDIKDLRRDGKKRRKGRRQLEEEGEMVEEEEEEDGGFIFETMKNS